ncbi:hypothetical protein Pelo_19703 [Pelomyxa schiedti]|nr:hypothetical protein Pelo_19703 [Pelomyxa schiedti]
MGKILEQVRSAIPSKNPPIKALLCNVDNLSNLEVVEDLLADAAEATDRPVSATLKMLSTPNYRQHCLDPIEGQFDVAVLALSAGESRLSVNEKNSGIGYAAFYKKLRDATQDHVAICWTGDNSSSRESVRKNFSLTEVKG